MKQKRWLSCILILEKNIKDKSKLIINFYNSIGFCYYYLKIYSLSEYFYEQAIRKKNNDTTILCNLAQVYTKNNKYQQAIKIYQAVLRLESNNKVAQQQLDKLTT
ncbi:tetratricopeptide repeat protein [Bacillus paranthracis]|uniref:tetratricopeptide repeat protein n=1 Tax=Bacillus paranthracis TaxID=2026186 RepID=UPI003D64617E